MLLLDLEKMNTEKKIPEKNMKYISYIFKIIYTGLDCCQ